MDPEENEGQGTETESVANEGQEQQQQEDKLNPAWNDLLQVVPSQLHSQVTPHLKNWDRNFQTELNKVNERYAPYKDYLENDVQPEQINYALNVLRAIEENPGEVINAIRQYAVDNNITIEEAAQEVTEGATQEGEGNEDDPFLNSPAYQEMRQQIDTLAQFLVSQQQEQTESEEDEALAQEFEELQEKYKDTFGEKGFDEQWVLTRAINDDGQKPLEEYVKEYQAFVNELLAEQRRPGPKVVNGGGAAPNNQISPKEMNDQQRRAYIADMLKQAAENNS